MVLGLVKPCYSAMESSGGSSILLSVWYSVSLWEAKGPEKLLFRARFSVK